MGFTNKRFQKKALIAAPSISLKPDSTEYQFILKTAPSNKSILMILTQYDYVETNRIKYVLGTSFHLFVCFYRCVKIRYTSVTVLSIVQLTSSVTLNCTLFNNPRWSVVRALDLQLHSSNELNQCFKHCIFPHQELHCYRLPIKARCSELNKVEMKQYCGQQYSILVINF